MARNKNKSSKSKTFKVSANDPGLGFSPALQCASMARTDSRTDVKQRERKNAKQYAKHNWRKEY
jgi:hypothetical protein